MGRQHDVAVAFAVLELYDHAAAVGASHAEFRVVQSAVKNDPELIEPAGGRIAVSAACAKRPSSLVVSNHRIDTGSKSFHGEGLGHYLHAEFELTPERSVLGVAGNKQHFQPG